MTVEVTRGVYYKDQYLVKHNGSSTWVGPNYNEVTGHESMDKMIIRAVNKIKVMSDYQEELKRREAEFPRPGETIIWTHS